MKSKTTAAEKNLSKQQLYGIKMSSLQWTFLEEYQQHAASICERNTQLQKLQYGKAWWICIESAWTCFHSHWHINWPSNVIKLHKTLQQTNHMQSCMHHMEMIRCPCYSIVKIQCSQCSHAIKYYKKDESILINELTHLQVNSTDVLQISEQGWTATTTTYCTRKKYSFLHTSVCKMYCIVCNNYRKIMN